MIRDILPPTFDNNYRGRKMGLWIFGFLLLVRTAMGGNSLFNGNEVVRIADGIPIDSFTRGGAQTVVSLFALLGLATLILCLVGMIVLVRYRSMIPFMYVLFLIEHLCKRLILFVLPVVRVGTPPGFYVNLVLLAGIIAGLLLSLWNRKSVAHA